MGHRFTDILTNASAIADYLGQPIVTAHHLLQAIDILEERLTMEDLGRPSSPMLRNFRQPSGADPAIREFAQRWYAELGSNVQAELTDGQLAVLVSELRALGTSANPED